MEREGEEAKGHRLDAMFEATYAELRNIAHAVHRYERRDHTLDPTAVVHEAYMRLAKNPDFRYHDEDQFKAYAARVIRQVLVDSARSKKAAKRGGDWQRVTLEGNALTQTPKNLDVLDLDEALARLEEKDPQKVRVVELRFFSGLSIEEAAESLGVSVSTVGRDWRLARAWLVSELLPSRRPL